MVGIDVCIYLGLFEYLVDLVVGCIDVVLNDSLLVGYILKLIKLLLKVGSLIGIVDKIGIFFCKGNLEFKVVLNKVLVDIKVDGSFKVVFEKWFGIDVS